MIKTFADNRTKELYESGKSKRFPPGIWERAVRKLEYLDLATSVTEHMYFRAIDFTNWSETGLGSIRFSSTTNGECAFDLKMAMRTMLR